MAPQLKRIREVPPAHVANTCTRERLVAAVDEHSGSGRVAGQVCPPADCSSRVGRNRTPGLDLDGHKRLVWADQQINFVSATIPPEVQIAVQTPVNACLE
ncbi:MAG: hypothetical protein ACI9BV_003505 [Rhodothermales bacterium]